MIYTSGTTSRPKGVVHSVGTLLAATRNYVECAELHRDDRLFVISPLASITGLLQSITVPPMLGARVVLETKWDPDATCDLLLESGGTFFGGTARIVGRGELQARGVFELAAHDEGGGGAEAERTHAGQRASSAATDGPDPRPYTVSVG